MGLFSIFDSKKKTIYKSNSSERNQQQELRRFEYTSAKNFRGYKLTSLVANGYSDYAENTNRLIEKHGEVLENLPVAFVVYSSNKEQFAELEVDGFKVGAVYPTHEYYKEIISGKIKGIYVRNSVKSTVNLDTKKTTEVNHIQMLLKFE